MFFSPLFRTRALVATLVLCALPLTANAIEAPISAVTADTSTLVWLDFEHSNAAELADEFQRLSEVFASDIRAPDAQIIKTASTQFVDFHDKFVASGGNGLLIGMGRSAEKTAAGQEKTETYILINTKADADRSKLEALLHGYAQQFKGNEALSGDILSSKIEAYGTNTQWHALTGEKLVFPPLNGTAADAAVFNGALQTAEKGSVQLCYRLTQSNKDLIQAQLDEQAKNPQDGDMMNGMMAGILAPTLKLETITLVADGAKGGRKINTSAHFSDAKNAADFASAGNALLQMGKGLAGMQIAQFSKYGVDAKNVNAILTAFVLQEKGDNVELPLDDAFLAKVEVFAQQMQVAKEKMQAEQPKTDDAMTQEAMPAEEEAMPGEDQEMTPGAPPAESAVTTQEADDAPPEDPQKGNTPAEPAMNQDADDASLPAAQK